MRHRFLGAGLLLASILAVPVLGAPKAPATKTGPAVDAENLPAGQFTGTLVTAPGSDRTFTVRISFQRLQLRNTTQVPRANYGLNQSLLRKQQEILRLQQQMARSRQPVNEMRRIQQLMGQMQLEIARQQLRPQQLPYQAVTSAQEVEFQVTEDVKVRTLVLPDVFDDKGNIKKYTAKELKELKGKDSHLPGYESAVENLTPGQVVQITLAAAKKPNPAAGKDKDKAKDKDADLDKDKAKDKDKDLDKDKAKDKDKGADKEKAKDTTGEKKMQVRLVVIVKDDSATSAGGTNARKKR
jgi:hypothetical protein